MSIKVLPLEKKNIDHGLAHYLYEVHDGTKLIARQFSCNNYIACIIKRGTMSSLPPVFLAPADMLRLDGHLIDSSLYAIGILKGVKVSI